MPSSAEGRRLAIAAEALYLINLLMLPGLGFIALATLYWRRHRHAPPLAAAHLEQTLAASLWAGVLIALISGVLWLAGGGSAAGWTMTVLWFTVAHTSLVLLGIIGLAHAMAGRCWHFPLVGRRLPHGCGKPTP
ncbi:hypothetical protein [Endothiovibrio diazotrophicus]